MVMPFDRAKASTVSALICVLVPALGHAAVLPNFILRPLAMHFCEYKVSPFTLADKRKALCGCAWKKIAAHRGEKTALLDGALTQQNAHWRTVEARQIDLCAKKEGLFATLQRVEHGHPTLALAPVGTAQRIVESNVCPSRGRWFWVGGSWIPPCFNRCYRAVCFGIFDVHPCGKCWVSMLNALKGCE